MSRRTKDKIRRAEGHGKFEGCDLLDGAAYVWGMESNYIHSREHAGDSVTLVEGPFSAIECREVTVDYDKKLNRRERQFVQRQKAALVFESGDGFINVEWYNDLDKCRERFDELSKYYYPEDEENEDDDE